MDQFLDQLRAMWPGLHVYRGAGVDDAGPDVYWLQLDGVLEVRVQTEPAGRLPFTIRRENTDPAAGFEAATLETATQHAQQLLSEKSELARITTQVDYANAIGYCVRIDVLTTAGAWDDVLLTIEEARQLRADLDASISVAEREQGPRAPHDWALKKIRGTWRPPELVREPGFEDRLVPEGARTL